MHEPPTVPSADKAASSQLPNLPHTTAYTSTAATSADAPDLDSADIKKLALDSNRSGGGADMAQSIVNDTDRWRGVERTWGEGVQIWKPRAVVEDGAE